MSFLLPRNETEFHGCEQGMLWSEHGNSPGMWLILTAHTSQPLRTPRRLPPHACRAGWAQSRCSYSAGLLPDRVPFHFCSHIGVQKCGCEFLKTRNITFTRVKTPHALKMCKTYCLQSFLRAPKPFHKCSTIGKAISLCILCFWGAENFSSFPKQLIFHRWGII